MALTNTQREELVAKISQIDGLNSEERSALIDALRQRDSYGLHWEDKPEEAEERLRVSLPILTEVTSKRITNGGDNAPNHILIEGDNLEALTALTYTHAGKIDVIYIDPPYNTGNKDFCYNDKYVDSEDSYRHSKWLSFMSKRLRIAKQLLSDRGVIFISIDDNEQANLKLLCDKVFGSNNYVACISWQRTYSTRNDSRGIPKEVESILVFSKNQSWTPNKLPRTDKMNSLYKSPDNDPKPWTSSSVSAPGAATHQGMVYAIQQPFTGKMMYPTTGRCWSLGQEAMLQNMKCWCEYKLENIHDEKQRAAICGIDEKEVRQDVLAIVLAEPQDVAKARAESILRKGNWPYFYFTSNGKGGLRRKTYLSEMDGKIATNFFSYDDCGHTDEAKKEIISLFDGNAPFDTPKPTRLLKQILTISSHSNSTILDFFAGSGTTLHAVMQLNKEDGGHRQCILVTNNENGICENVTYERNKRVINGYTKPNGESVEGLHANNLRYYRTMLLPRDTSHHCKEQLMWQLTDQLCIKEDLYAETDIVVGGSKVKKQYAQCFASARRTMIIIYRPEVIKHVAEFIKDVPAAKEVKVYVFSDGQYAFDDDFGEALGRITLCALPDALYQAYRTALPDRPRATAWTVDSDSPEAIEALNATQNQTYVTEAEEQS